MATYQRGVVTAVSGSPGLIQSIDVDSAVQEATAKDEDGNTAVVEHYDPTLDVTAEVVWDTSTTLPDLTSIDGTATTEILVTLSGCVETNFNGQYYVQGVTNKESNEGFLSTTLKLKRYAANSLPATT